MAVARIVLGPQSRKDLNAPCHEWSSLHAEEAHREAEGEDACEACGETEDGRVVCDGEDEAQAEACDAVTRHGRWTRERSIDAGIA